MGTTREKESCKVCGGGRADTASERRRVRTEGGRENRESVQGMGGDEKLRSFNRRNRGVSPGVGG